jgi:hypothetical protein
VSLLSLVRIKKPWPAPGVPVSLRKSDYRDVSDVQVDDAKREQLYDAQTECCLLGVMVRFVWSDGRFWVTCAAERKRVPALRTRPQSAVVVSSEGTWLGGDITTTAKTLATVHDDDETKAWFYPALALRQRRGDDETSRAARTEFLRRLDTPTRVVIELDPVAWITYDGNRLEAALRGVDYDPTSVKPTRNLTAPPAGVELRTL